MLKNIHINCLKKEWLLNTFFFLFIALVLANRLYLFFTVNQTCIDNDQAVMWQGAKDFSNGIYHVPLFYGQDYNTLIEALVATPLVLCNVPIYMAVPIATHLLFLFPFLFTAVYLFKKQKKEQALVTLAILLCMPVGYDIMNSIPRGFVTGLCFTSFFCITLFNPTNYKWLVINTFLGVIGYMVNPNSVLVTAPFLGYVFLCNYKQKVFYVYSLLAVVPGILILLSIKYFYAHYPNPLVYNLNNEFSFSYLIDSFAHINQRLMHVSFFKEGNGVFMLLLFIILGVLFFKKDKNLFLSFIGFIIVLIIAFSSSKSADGAEWAFYSYSRLYLGIPVFLYLFIALFDVKTVLAPIIVVTLVFTIKKEVQLKNAVTYHSDEKKWSHLNLVVLDDLKNQTETYARYANENKARFFIIGNVWHDDFINYASDILNPNFPKTFKPSYERRSWLITEECHKIYARFLILVREPKRLEALNNPNIKKLDDYGLYLVTKNALTVEEFLNTIDCPIYKGDSFK